jgi:SagB-type dehydrogenase family enzyme
MSADRTFFRWTELDRTTFPEFRDRILQSEQEGMVCECRSYRGYPRWPLVRVRPRPWVGLEQILCQRRSIRALDVCLPSRKVLSRLLQFGHGIQATENRGPVPSAGGLQALELYLVLFQSDWLPAGLYHYDRQGHYLAQLAAPTDRLAWQERVPSLSQVAGGAFLWVLVGDGVRTRAKYGERGQRFLLLEAGHLLQNLCLLSASVGLSTVPLGGFFERAIARQFQLPTTDHVLYVGVCGKIASRAGT